MSVLVVALLKFTNRARYGEYLRQFPALFAGSGGELLAADEAPEALEGDSTQEAFADKVDKVVIMRFPSTRHARAFIDGDAYQRISVDRRAGARTSAWLVHEVEPTQGWRLPSDGQEPADK